MRWTPPWRCPQWWQNHRSSQRESQIWSCPSSMDESVAEPQSDEEKNRIKESKDLMFLSNNALRRVSKYLPDKYIACYAQGFCGRGSHRYLHQPRDLHTKHMALKHAGRFTRACDAVRCTFQPSEWATALFPKSKGSTWCCWRTPQWAEPEEGCKTRHIHPVAPILSGLRWINLLEKQKCCQSGPQTQRMTLLWYSRGTPVGEQQRGLFPLMVCFHIFCF